MKQGTLLVMSGFSGVGKSTVIAQVRQKRPELHFSVSFTTRPPREGEENGVHYYFVSREEFKARISAGEFLEYAEYAGNFYGTSRKVIQDYLDRGVDVLLDIEVQGAANVKKQMPQAALVFIIPPSFEELAQRLRNRGTDSEETIQKRLAIARKEADSIPLYDYIVKNDTVPHAVEEVLAILTAEGCRTEKRLEGENAL